jgi:ribonuclease P protein component
MKRRLREALRPRLDRFGAGWDIVFNPRTRILQAPFAEIEREVEKLLLKCNGS